MTNKATFAAGCFWGVEEAFGKVEGVLMTKVGYSGETKEKENAEVVEIEFDENIVSYKELLDIFWKIHDPTQKDKQGPNIGSQYRSVIFYHNEEQKEQAIKSKKEQQKKVATEISPVSKFHLAEQYHQKYFKKSK